VFFVVLLLFLPEGDLCSTLVIVVLGYAAFSIFASSVAEAWRNVAPPKTLQGRARLYRDVAARCLRAAGRYPFAGDNLRREARYYERRIKEMRKRMQPSNALRIPSSIRDAPTSCALYRPIITTWSTMGKYLYGNDDS